MSEWQRKSPEEHPPEWSWVPHPDTAEEVEARRAKHEAWLESLPPRIEGSEVPIKKPVRRSIKS